MPGPAPHPLDLTSLTAEQFDITSLEDEIRVDALCVSMIRTFFTSLEQQPDLDPADIGRVCHGIDYFLREFIVAENRDNLLRVNGGHVRRFAGHWYIIKNLEPNMTELGLMLDGITAFYQFLAGYALISPDQVATIRQECGDRTFYQQRIEDFWAIEGDGFLAWREEVPL